MFKTPDYVILLIIFDIWCNSTLEEESKQSKDRVDPHKLMKQFETMKIVKDHLDNMAKSFVSKDK